MFKSRSVAPAARGTELETVTDWRMIAVGAGVLLTALAVPGVVAVRRNLEPAPADRAERRPLPPPAAVTPVGTAVAIQPQLSFPPVDSYAARKQPAPPAAAPPAAAPPVAAVAWNPPAPAAAPDTRDPAAAAVLPQPIGWQAETRRWDRPPTLPELQLLESLEREVPEVKLDRVAGTSKRLLATPTDKHPLLAELADRGDLAGLPARGAEECKASTEATAILRDASQTFSRWRRQRPANPWKDRSQVPALVEADMVERSFGEKSMWSTAATVRLMEQVLQAEGVPVRLLLVRQLSKIADPLASAALARRAVFDVSVDVRDAACEALGGRPTADVLPTLMRALRHPWPPAARHAAEALVYLGEYGAIGELAELAKLPDPLAPAYDTAKKAWVKPELVRVNHFANCLLCHAASNDRKDPVRGPVPDPNEAIRDAYYGSFRGPAVRADITYLVQDFSATLYVAKAAPWPDYQRFDFLVRRREVSEADAKAMLAARRGDYPQRQAVLFALRELGGADDVASPAGRTPVGP